MTNKTFTNNIKLFDNESQQRYYDSFKGLTPIENWICEHYFPKGSLKVLDIGCGAARTTIELYKMGYQVTGIDISETLLSKGKALYPQLDLHFMNATELSFGNESFDIVVFSFNGIDSIYPETLRNKVFEEAYRVLKTGGIFYYTSHSVNGMITRELKTGKKGIKKILRFLRNQSSLSKCMNGFWNHKEENEDNWAFAKTAKFNAQKFDPARWKLLQVVGSDRFGSDDMQILFNENKWLTPANTAHNHFVLQKR
jgi:SAM-dependent methyltransferase